MSGHDIVCRNGNYRTFMKLYDDSFKRLTVLFIQVSLINIDDKEGDWSMNLLIYTDQEEVELKYRKSDYVTVWFTY